MMQDRLGFSPPRALALLLWMLMAACLNARAAVPAITLSSPSTPASQTTSESIALQGSADNGGKLINVIWVNQFGKRGGGQLIGSHGWSVSVPLRQGINLITVTAIDATKHSASLHVVVNRLPTAATAPAAALPLGRGYVNNKPITYQVWNGLPVVEGDILLSGVTANAAKPITTGTVPAAANTPVQSGGLLPGALTIAYTSQLWPLVNGVHQVPYLITSLNNSGQCTGSGSSTALTAAITAFNNAAFNANYPPLIQFVPYTNQANYVNICVNGNGSGEGFSYVGLVNPLPAGGQLLECGSGCTEATWLHEMGHTIGLLHEHQRPDRASYITLNLANADLPNVPGNFTLFSYDSQTLGLYDYASVMHYGAFDFSKAGLPVLESIPAGIPLSNNTGYSVGDIDTIERLYGATPSTVTVTTNPVGLQIVVDGTTYNAPQTFSFALGSTHTLALPADPQNTNPADGSTYAFGNWNDLGARSHTITVTGGTGTLGAPAAQPAVTVYEANFIRLQPFVMATPSVYPADAGTLTVTPSPISEYGSTFLTDRTLVTMSLSSNSGFNFYDWFNLPYPPSDNPHSFYLQAPVTAGQAVYVTTSVTLVGESLTGPNTWNPGLAGSVDGQFTYLPSAFSSYYNGASWNPGTTHTVSVGQTQSPITTNVYYNWNSWSDTGALSHSITQPASGTQTINASLTPYYATYTSPPPLGSGNAACAGGVATTPAGTSYALNSSFAFYADNTSVTSTATANSTYPPFQFTGWSGSTGGLSGSTNPQVVTIHDQFVPTATFNLISAPLAITSTSPSSAVANGSALDVTINGSGFTNNDTYVYWNGGYRSITFVNSNQLILHLQAGDLATAGGQDIYIGNYFTNTSGTCSVTAEATFTLGATPPAGDGATAKFTGKNSATQGTWTGIYGSDGYLIANDVTNAPSYASVSLTGSSAYTWTASTTDPRALQTSSGASTRIASTFYSTSNFTINVNITDGNTHRIGLYLLDWDSAGRSETVSILDAGTNAVLDTQSFSGFQGGQYAVWNVSGHVLVKVTLSGGGNAVVSGIFFDPSSSAKYDGTDAVTQGTWTGTYGEDGVVIANGTNNAPSYAGVSISGASSYTWTASTTDPRALQTARGSSTRIASTFYSASTITFNVNLTDGKTHRVGLYLLDWDAAGRAETISVLDAGTNAVLDTETYSGFQNGQYAVWNLKGHVLIQVTVTAGSNAVVSGLFFGTPAPALAAYAGADSTTKGTWTGNYGEDGEIIANGATNLPSYAAVSSTGAAYTWTASTTDPRALQTASGSSTRIASAFYSSGGFTIDLNVTDGNTHRVALYLLDWDSAGRSETVSIMDAGTNALLDTESFSGFQNGVYAAWNISGHVHIQVTLTGGPNAVVSGIFFGAPATVKFTGLDTTTKGTWTGKYGADGNLIANDEYDPASYAAISMSGDNAYTWTASTSDTRALQTSSGSSTRIASAYYTPASLSMDLNLTDGRAHRIALYLLDWDAAGRAENISIIDANSNAVLDTESIEWLPGRRLRDVDHHGARDHQAHRHGRRQWRGQRGLLRSLRPKSLRDGGPPEQPAKIVRTRDGGAVHEPDHGVAVTSIAPKDVRLAIAIEIAGHLGCPVRGCDAEVGRGCYGAAVHEPDVHIAIGVPPNDVRVAGAREVADRLDGPRRRNHPQVGCAGHGIACTHEPDDDVAVRIAPKNVGDAVIVEVTGAGDGPAGRHDTEIGGTGERTPGDAPQHQIAVGIAPENFTDASFVKGIDS